MREVCDFSGMGKIVCLYLMNFFVSHLVYLLIIYVFIEFYLSLSGVVSAERDVLEIKTRRNECFKAKPNLRLLQPEKERK